MKVALIGYGYWGRNLARTINENSNIELTSIFDIDAQHIEEAKKLYSFKEYYDVDTVLSSDIDAVFIATPPATHYEIAKKALLAGKHIFVEKPFTTSLDEAYELLELSEKKGLVAMVDHIFCHAEPIKYLKQNIDQFGDIVYINARRINLGLFQYTTDVIWDLAVHDLSIIDYLVGLDIKRTSVFKKKYKDFPNEAIANIDLELMNGTVVNINVSWLSPVKVREMVIGGTKKTAIYDDTKAKTISEHTAGVVLEKEMNKSELYSQMVKYNYGEIFEPELPSNMSLNNSVQHFYECVADGAECLTGKSSIIRVTKALEIISKIG